TATFLAFLGSLDDTHIVRKLGPGVAREVRLRAAELSRRLALEPDPSALGGALLAFDAELKAAGINPGTSADLTVATVFARNLLVKPATVMVKKVTSDDAKQAVQMFGPAQRAVALAVADCVAEGTIPESECEDLFICVGVFIHWEASDDSKIQDYNYQATKLS